MIQSTNSSIEGRKIREYHSVVTGEAILGANLFKDFFAGIRDIVGGRSAAYEKELRKARTVAFEEMEEQAAHLGTGNNELMSYRRAGCDEPGNKRQRRASK